MRVKPRIGWVRADEVGDERTAHEILKLRRSVDELETQIAQSGLTPPPGTEALAQGDETLTLRLRFSDINDVGVCPLDFTWNEIVSFLGPIFIIQASEVELKEKLVEVFSNRLKDSGAEVPFPSIVDEDFQKVKLQLRALGLIRELKETPGSGDQALWTLTPYGDRVMTQVAAIKSSAKA
ncbi:MAG TPA: hypothetical protein VME17_23120 [Bryobacteraceae bacterium]|nr:hypothetical protein [Bryobacteraceae bacterium]